MKNPNLPDLIVKNVGSKNDDYTVLSFDGDLDKLGLELVRSQVDEVVEKLAGRFLVFDFTALNFINSESIGYLITIHYRLIKKEKALVIVKASNYVKDVLQVIGVSDFIKTYETMADFEESIK
jgi:anti-anti-sigma factor